MSEQDNSQYLLLWKGRQFGPLSLVLIRERLASGELSRMHQVNYHGKWIVLDEFLDKYAGEDPDVKRRSSAANREEQLRSEFESQLAEERARQNILEARLAKAEDRSSLTHLLPRPASQPPPLPLSSPPPPSLPPPPQRYAPSQGGGVQAIRDSAPAHTSGLAIAALVMALCNFVPYLGFATWLLALIFGHTALSRMKSDPALTGRGMAVAALVITYFILAIGSLIIVLYLVTRRHL
jgi:hypothetical protein